VIFVEQNGDRRGVRLKGAIKLADSSRRPSGPKRTNRILEELREEMDRIREAIDRLSRWSDKMRLARHWAIVRKRACDAIDALIGCIHKIGRQVAASRILRFSVTLAPLRHRTNSSFLALGRSIKQLALALDEPPRPRRHASRPSPNASVVHGAPHSTAKTAVPYNAPNRRVP